MRGAHDVETVAVVPSRVLCMVYNRDGDAAAAVSAKRWASVPYTLREKIVMEELWAEFKRWSDTIRAGVVWRVDQRGAMVPGHRGVHP
jgi:hypothetical protein